MCAHYDYKAFCIVLGGAQTHYQQKCDLQASCRLLSVVRLHKGFFRLKQLEEKLVPKG
jgi:hypothetical protein